VKKQDARTILALLFLVNLLNFYDRQILAFVTEPVRLEWNLSDTQIGWIGTAFTLVYAAIGLPLGRLADRLSRTRLLAASVAVWSLFTAASGAAWGYWSMFAARMGVGIGEAGCSPAANSLIGDLYPPERRARAIGLFMLGLPIGILLSSVLSGLIARSFGWRMAFLAATVPGLLLAIVIVRIPDSARITSVKPSAARTPASWTEPYRELWRIPTLRWLVISGALHNFNAYAVNAFLPAYLMRYHGLSLAQASIGGGLTLGAVGVVSLLLGGTLADRARRRSVNARLLFGASSALLAAPLMLAALLLPRGEALPFIALMGIAWMLFYVYYVTTYPSIHDVVRPELRGTAMAVYFFWMYVLGGAFGTAILGMLSDRFARRAMSLEGASTITETARATGLHDAFLVAPAMTFLLGVVLFAASRTMKRDMASVTHS
jgi:MFS family permease